MVHPYDLAHGFPYVRCDSCRHSARCASGVLATAPYPRCFAPTDPADPDALVRWFAAARPPSGAHDGRLDAVQDILVETFATETRQSWNVLEMSVSWDRDGVHPLRLSYAFPPTRGTMAARLASVRAMVEPFGAGLDGWVDQACEFARDPTVEQPLFGLAYDGPKRWRVKLYLQFRDGAGARLRALLCETYGLPPWPEGDPLHLVGLDLTSQGLAAIKLYFVTPRLDLRGSDPLVRAPLIQDIAGLGLRELYDVVRVYRVSRRGGPMVLTDIDVGNIHNGLHAADVWRLPGVQLREGGGGAVRELYARLPILFRWLGGSVASRDKLTVYFSLVRSIVSHPPTGMH